MPSAWVPVSILVTAALSAQSGCGDAESESVAPTAGPAQVDTEAPATPDLVYLTEGADYWGKQGRPLRAKILWPGPFTWDDLFGVANPLVYDGRPWGNYTGIGRTRLDTGIEYARFSIWISNWNAASTELFKYCDEVGLPKSAFFIIHHEDERFFEDDYEHLLVQYGFQSTRARKPQHQ